MPIDAVLLHMLALVFPGWLLSLLFAIVTRVIYKGTAHRLSFWRNFTALGLSASAVLVLGLLLQGEDGRILTYFALVAVLATLQWFILRRR